MEAESLPDYSGEEAYPDISWCGRFELGNPSKIETIHQFFGKFPFDTYADYVWGGQFEIECPFCGNELLCSDNRGDDIQASFWTKRFCDECGARVIVPMSGREYHYKNTELRSCAGIDGWSLFYDELKRRFHLVHNEHCQEAMLNGWRLILVEDIPMEYVDGNGNRIR